MKKTNLAFLISFILGCAFSTASLACYETAYDIPEKNKEEVFSQAYAVGMFKVIKSDKNSITYQTIAPYNEFIEKEIIVRRVAHQFCSPGPYTDEMHFYDLIILKRNNEFFLSEVNMKAEDWDNLRGNSHFGEKYKFAKTDCELSGGDWNLQKGWGFPVHYCIQKKD